MFCGKRAIESRICLQFQVAILSVHRQEGHIKEKSGDNKFRARDTVLLKIEPVLVQILAKTSIFASKLNRTQPPLQDRLHVFILVTIVVAMSRYLY